MQWGAVFPLSGGGGGGSPSAARAQADSGRFDINSNNAYFSSCRGCGRRQSAHLGLKLALCGQGSKVHHAQRHEQQCSLHPGRPGYRILPSLPPALTAARRVFSALLGPQ